MVESISNDELKDLLEDMFDVKAAFKALVNSKMAKKNQELGLKTLEDEHFQKIWAWFQEDMEFEGLDGLEKKCIETLEAIRTRAKNCPIQQKLKKQIIKLIKTIKKTRIVSDVPQWIR